MNHIVLNETMKYEHKFYLELEYIHVLFSRVNKNYFSFLEAISHNLKTMFLQIEMGHFLFYTCLNPLNNYQRLMSILISMAIELLVYVSRSSFPSCKLLS